MSWNLLLAAHTSERYVGGAKSLEERRCALISRMHRSLRRRLEKESSVGTSRSTLVSDHSSVFQTEVAAINVAADVLFRSAASFSITGFCVTSARVGQQSTFVGLRKPFGPEWNVKGSLNC